MIETNPTHTAALDIALRPVLARLAEHVEAARSAPDARALSRALNECWFAIYDAQELASAAAAEDAADTEEVLDATANPARSEVGLVGTGGGRQ